VHADSRKKVTPTHVCEREGPLCTCEKWGTVRRKEEKNPPTAAGGGRRVAEVPDKAGTFGEVPTHGQS
jgi:hypothetical protein